MIDLILTMLTAYEEYGTALNFDENDIKNFIKNYSISFDEIERDINELGWIILWENKLISDKYFCKLMEIEIISGDTYLVINNFNDILSKDYIFEIEILNGEYDYNPSDYNGYDIGTWWYYYNENTKKEIIKYCIDNGLEIDDELLTDENLIFKNDDIYFNDQKFVNYIDDRDLIDLNNILNDALSEAQDSADADEYYNKIKNAFEKDIGDIEHKSKKVIKEDKEKTVDLLYIKLNISWSEIKSELEGLYNKFEFEDCNYGNLQYILNEIEYFNFKKPYYDYISGSIDKDTLNEYTVNRLEWD
jgi:hypothetical protein